MQNTPSHSGAQSGYQSASQSGFASTAMPLMNAPALLLHYVKDVAVSLPFYRQVFGVEPVEASPAFAMFVLPSGLRFGIWARQEVQPPVSAIAGAHELALAVPTRDAVDALHAAWCKQMPVLQAPTEMDFGYTFTASDPDGQRLRLYCPAG